MANNLEHIMTTISDIAGEPDNVYEKCFNSKLEDDVEQLEKQIVGAKQALQHLDCQCESVQTELDAQLEVQKSMTTSLKEDVDSFRNKGQILTTYMNFVKSDEFEINKLKKGLNVNCHQLREDLMQFVQKKQELQKRWQYLNGLAEECAPIKEQVERLQSKN